MARLALPPLMLAPVAMLLTACGGGSESRPERPAPGVLEAIDECAAAEQRLSEGWEFQSIVDFEPPDGMTPAKLRPACQPETPCGFYFNYDSVLSPTATNDGCGLGEGVVTELNQMVGPPFAYPLPETRCESSGYAYHLQGQNVSTCVSAKTGRTGWGATLAVTLNANPKDSGQALEPYDASSWDGVSFWVRLGDAPSNRALIASAKDPYTSRPPASSKMEQYCSTADGMADARKCDPFGRAVLLQPQWRFVALPFSLMQQKGFGVPSPLGSLDATQLVGLELGFAPGDWDLWLDDIAFYREPR